MTYRFGPLERRGMIAGWRGGQVVALGVGAALALAALQAFGASGLLIAGAVLSLALIASLMSVRGRTPEQWAPVLLGFGFRRAVRARVRSSIRELLGPDGAAPVPPRYGPLAGLALESLETEGHRFGAIRDHRFGSVTAAIQVFGPGAVLAGGDERRAQAEAWGRAIAGLATQESSGIVVQWILRCRATPNGELVEHLRRLNSGLLDGLALADQYRNWLASRAYASNEHECLLAATVKSGSTGGRWRRAPGRTTTPGSEDATRLWEALSRLGRDLAQAGILSSAPLAPASLAYWIVQTGHRPSRPALASGYEPVPDVRRSVVNWPWPVAVDESWGHVQVDGAYMALYWVAEWPRSEVGDDFLFPLLIVDRPLTTFSVRLRPLSLTEATREVVRARVADRADRTLRERAGFAVSARRQLEEDWVQAREVALATGHLPVVFCGHLAVTSATEAELDRACGELESRALACHLEIRRLYGQQAKALVATLPSGRGALL